MKQAIVIDGRGVQGTVTKIVAYLLEMPAGLRLAVRLHSVKIVTRSRPGVCML